MTTFKVLGKIYKYFNEGEIEALGTDSIETLIEGDGEIGGVDN